MTIRTDMNPLRQQVPSASESKKLCVEMKGSAIYTYGVMQTQTRQANQLNLEGLRSTLERT